MTEHQAIAPGKVFLLGEYAVLDGYGGLVGAVPRVVRARYSPAAWPLIVSHSLSSEVTSLADPAALTAAIDGPVGRVAAGLLAVREVLGGEPGGGTLHVDSSALFENGRKLGFGSSAAVAVASLAAIALASDIDVEDPAFRRRVFLPTRSWHNRAQQALGSGGDVAASLVGGVAWLRVREAGAELEPVPAPEHVALLVHPWSASTPAQVASIKQYRARDPAGVARHLRRLGTLADQGRQALVAKDSEAWVEIVRAANTALAALGRDAGASICTPLHDAVRVICEAAGGACKPAGAGGGDLSLISAASAESLAAICRTLAQRGHATEPLLFSSHGVRRA